MKIKNKKLRCGYVIFDVFRYSRFGIRYSRFAGGFALTELLIALALFSIAAAIVVITFNVVSERLFTKNLAYAIALSFRQAQSYGVSVRGTSATDFTAGYGLHFDAGDGNSKVFLLFADTNGDSRFNSEFGKGYDESGCLSGNECIESFRVERNNKIEKFCGVLPIDSAPAGEKMEECDIGTYPLISRLDVLFKRPYPDAIINTDLSGAAERYKGARIYVISPRGERGTVEVMNTGQISVK